MEGKTAGFTLMEVILVIVIIGILTTISFLTLINTRYRALDVRRLADVKQIQYALDAFLDMHGDYPEDQEFAPGTALVSRNGHVTFLNNIPSNPEPRAVGGCADEDYVYHQRSDGKSYVLQYCLSGKVSDLAPGVCQAMPGAVCVQNIICSCSDITKPCCGNCNTGDQCGGGAWPLPQN